METYLRIRRQMLAAMVIVAAWAHMRPVDAFDWVLVLMLGVPLAGWVLLIQRRHVWLVAHSAVCTGLGTLIAEMFSPAANGDAYQFIEFSQYRLAFDIFGAIVGWLVGVLTIEREARLQARSANQISHTLQASPASSGGSPGG
jgi:hypothetical protein